MPRVIPPVMVTFEEGCGIWIWKYVCTWSATGFWVFTPITFAVYLPPIDRFDCGPRNVNLPVRIRMRPVGHVVTSAIGVGLMPLMPPLGIHVAFNIPVPLMLNPVCTFRVAAIGIC